MDAERREPCKKENAWCHPLLTSASSEGRREVVRRVRNVPVHVAVVAGKGHAGFRHLLVVRRRWRLPLESAVGNKGRSRIATALLALGRGYHRVVVVIRRRATHIVHDLRIKRRRGRPQNVRVDGVGRGEQKLQCDGRRVGRAK